MATDLNTILTWFETGDFPTENQFREAWSSFWHKDDEISMAKISGLAAALSAIVSSESFQNHLENQEAHANFLAKADASNLSAEQVTEWLAKLGVFAKEEVEGLLQSEQEERAVQIEALNQIKLDKPVNPTGLSVILDDGTTKPLSELNADELAELNYQINSLNTDNANQQWSINSLQTQLNIINNWKSALTNADADNIVNTLTELLAAFTSVPEGSDLVAMLSAKVSVVDIIDGLTSFAQNKPLSANQGRVLNNAITNLQNALINEATTRAQGDELKVNKPTANISNPDATYRYLPLLDYDGNSKRIDASNLGKNIGNSDLTLTSARTLDTAGKVFSITNLPDKSVDASFNKMKVQNASGQEAVSNGKELFKGIPAILDDTEKANFRTAMNGGWTTYTMSISNVFPRLIKNEDNPFWIDVMGSNLNLNPATMVVKVVNLLDNSETIINNNKVTLVSPNLIMVEINPSLFAQASYKIKLHNGVADILSGQSFRIASSVENIDVNAITWGKLAYTSGKENSIFPTASGGSVSYLSDSTNKAYGADASVVGSVKSSKLFSAGENFVIKGNVLLNTGNTIVNGSMLCGLMNSMISNSLNNNTIAYGKFTHYEVYTIWVSYDYGNQVKTKKMVEQSGSITSYFYIIKEGNQMTTVLRYGNDYLINTQTIADVDYAMQLIVLNSTVQVGYNMVITEAYSF